MIELKRLTSEEVAAKVLMPKTMSRDEAREHAEKLGLEAMVRMVELERPGWTVDTATVKAEITPVSPMLEMAYAHVHERPTSFDDVKQWALVHELDIWTVTAKTRPKTE